MKTGLKKGRIILLVLLLILLAAAIITFCVLYFGGTRHSTDRANAYVAENRSGINPQYRHSYHLMPEVGWCNDPNGFCFYDGEIHLFYQYNPYSAGWDTMHWGHAVSRDMIQWEYCPVALAPDSPYDKNGCFSGSAIEKDGELYLLYTGVNWMSVQQQCLAVSSDGITFEKAAGNPQIKAGLAKADIDNWNFRDPYVFRHEGVYYCVVGCKADGYGNLALFRSADLSDWAFVGFALDSDGSQSDVSRKLDGVYECPSFVSVDGCDVLICSPQNLQGDGNRFQNSSSVVCMVGRMDFDTGRFTYSDMQELDAGFDFYAAQATVLPDGRTVMTAWMQLWDRDFLTQGDGWTGAMILPRELTIRDGRLYQAPVREIEEYRGNQRTADQLELDSASIALDGFRGDTLELEAEFEIGSARQTGVKVFRGGEHETLIYYDRETQEVVLDRSHSGIPIAGREDNDSTRSVSVTPVDGKIKLRIFLDNTSCEVFVNDGYAVLTANIYADEADEGIEFYAQGGDALLLRAVKYDLNI